MMKKLIYLILLLAISYSCYNFSCPKSITQPQLAIQQEDDGYWILEKYKKVLFYQKTTKSINGEYPRANYIHPLISLDGDTLTEDFPEDHYHQRGIYWAWHQLWIGDKWICDGWTTENRIWDVTEVDAQVQQDGTATLDIEVLWKSPNWLDAQNNQKPMVKEQTTITVFPEQSNLRKIDFKIRLLALEENMRLGGSNDEKGYGGFSARIKLPADMQFISQKGLITPPKTAIEAGPWMQFFGSYTESNTSGLTIMCHPDQPGFPHPWILRQKDSMQNPAYPGKDPVSLSTTQPLELRYRLVIHRNELGKAVVDSLFNQYSNEY